MAHWDLGRGLYPLATGLFRFNYLPIVTIVLAQSALELLPLVTGSSPALAAVAVLCSTALQFGLSYLLLYTLMTGEGAVSQRFPWPHLGSYVWRVLVLGVPSMLILPLIRLSDDPVERMVLLFGALLASLAVMGLFGTVLPDLLADGAGRFGDAYQRGRKKFGRFLLWFVIGPVAAAAAFSLALGLVGGILMTVDADLTGAERRPAPWAAGLVTLLAGIGSAYITALMAAMVGKLWAAGGGLITPHRPAG